MEITNKFLPIFIAFGSIALISIVFMLIAILTIKREKNEKRSGIIKSTAINTGKKFLIRFERSLYDGAYVLYSNDYGGSWSYIMCHEDGWSRLHFDDYMTFDYKDMLSRFQSIEDVITFEGTEKAILRREEANDKYINQT